MRRSTWALALLFGASLLVLVSLYLPWQAASCATSTGSYFSSSNPTASLPNLFACPYGHIDGRSSVGDLATLSALLLALGGSRLALAESPGSRATGDALAAACVLHCRGFDIVGSSAAVIAVALVVAVVAYASSRRLFSPLELAVALSVLVASLGFLAQVGAGAA